MREFSKETIHMAEAISNAGKIVIYGAKQTAQELLPVCENLAARENITVTVSHLSENDPRFLCGYPIHEVADVVFQQDTVVLTAMTEHFFPEIAQMPQIKAAGQVFFLSLTEVIEAKRYAAIQNLKRLGIDVRLFDRLYASDLFTKSDISSVGYPSVRENVGIGGGSVSALRHKAHAERKVFYVSRGLSFLAQGADPQLSDSKRHKSGIWCGVRGLPAEVRRQGRKHLLWI